MPADLFTAPADPLNLTLTTEPGQAVVAPIGSAGGQLTAKGSDGTTYTLDIPAEAVLFPTDITMSPIVGVTGLPIDTAPEHLVGVRLEPDGLQLYAPATLRITPASPVPEAGVATMGLDGGGKDGGLVLFDRGPSEIRVIVEHFSAYTSFWPLDEEWWRRFERLRQEQAAKRLQNELATLLGIERQRQMVGFASLTLAEILVDVVKGWEAEVLNPLLKSAHNGCREASDAVAAYVVWERQLQLLGVSLANLTPEEYNQTTEDQRELYEKVRREIPPELLVLKRDLCFEEQFQRCRETGDFEFLMGFFLSYFRQHEWFGEEVSGEDQELAHRYLERCGRWDLTIESIEDIRAPAGSRAFVHQTRTYQIAWHPGSAGVYGLFGDHAVGDGATAIVEQTTTDAHCRVTNTYQGTAPLDTAEIERLIFDEPENAEPIPRKVQLGLAFGDQSWTRVQVCPDRTSSDTFTSLGGYLPTVLYVRDALNKHEWRFGSGPFGNGPFSAKMTITDTFTDTSTLPPISPDVEVIITLEHTPST